MGGVLAVANLRGGSEYGEDWHRAGTLANKQNVFDDFIACGEHLIAVGITSTAKLAILVGGVAAVMISVGFLRHQWATWMHVASALPMVADPRPPV